MIYIVDDDDSVCRATTRLLKSSGIAVQAFTSAEEFLQVCRPTAADCLLLDVQMPGISGLELHRQLQSSGIQVPVIFITAFDDKATREAARSAGAAGYFNKPFDEQALLDAIHFAVRPADSCGNSA